MKKWQRVFFYIHVAFWVFEFWRVSLYEPTIKDAVLEMASSLIAFYLMYFLVMPQIFKLRRALALLLSAIAFVVVFALAMALVSKTYGLPHEYHTQIWKGLGMLAYSSFYIGGMCLALRLGYDWRKNLEQTKSLQEQKTYSQIQFMKSNVNIPFIVQALEALEDVANQDPQHVKQPLLQLSNVLRYGTYDAMLGYVDIDKELEIMEEYISLINQSAHDYSLTLHVEGFGEPLHTVPNLMIKVLGYWRSQLSEVLKGEQQIFVRLQPCKIALMLPERHRFDLAGLMENYPEINSSLFRTKYQGKGEHITLTIQCLQP